MARERLPLRHAAGEALRNIFCRPYLFAIGILLTAATVCGAIMLDSAAVAEVLAQEQTYIDAGGEVLIASSAEGYLLDPHQCDRIGELPGVQAAVGVTHLPEVSVAGYAGVNQRVMAATWRVHELLDLPVDAQPLAVLAQPVAERWQLQPGSWLQLMQEDLPSQPLQISHVLPLAMLGDVYSTGLIVENAMLSGIDECVVAVDLNYKETIAGVAPTLLGDSAGSSVTLKEVATLGKFGQDAAESFQLRATRTAGLAAGVIVGVLWAVLSVIRSGRTALYRSLGVSYWEAYVVRIIEQGLPLLFGTLSGAASALLLTGLVLEATLEPQVTFDLISRHAGAALLLALAVMCTSALLQPRTLKTLKNR